MSFPPGIALDVRRVITAITDRLRSEGADAVALIGSYARGTAMPDSDIDLISIGAGEAYRLERVDDVLVSISWSTGDSIRKGFRSPLDALLDVPAWRSAVAIYDPTGLAVGLRDEAIQWTWDVPGRAACDAAVADGFYGYAEEVHKLVNNLARGRSRVAAVQRSVIALRMARIVALHERLLCETEDELWDAVADALGGEWRLAQSAALSEGGETLEESCQAALRLFALAAQRVEWVLNERQHDVASHACALAGYPFASTGGRT